MRFLREPCTVLAELQLIATGAIYRIWSRILCGGEVYIRDGGEIRECCTDDEDENGMCDANMDFVNPFVKLRLSRDCKPLEIVISMLGKPPHLRRGLLWLSSFLYGVGYGFWDRAHRVGN